MDISAYNYREMAEGGYTFALLHPETGEETDIRVSVIGQDSKAYNKAFTQTIRDANEDEELKNDTQAINARVYGACVTSIENMEVEGEPFEFSPENVIALLEQFPWLCSQVSAAVEKRVNFTKPPKKS